MEVGIRRRKGITEEERKGMGKGRKERRKENMTENLFLIFLE